MSSISELLVNRDSALDAIITNHSFILIATIYVLYEYLRDLFEGSPTPAYLLPHHYSDPLITLC